MATTQRQDNAAKLKNDVTDWYLDGLNMLTREHGMTAIEGRAVIQEIIGGGDGA